MLVNGEEVGTDWKGLIAATSWPLRLLGLGGVSMLQIVKVDLSSDNLTSGGR